MKKKKKTLLAQECEKREQLEEEREKEVRDGIVGLGVSRGILRRGLPSLPFFRCRRLKTKVGQEQIRSAAAYNMGIQLGRGRR